MNELKQTLSQGFPIVDCRSAASFVECHLLQSVNIPAESLFMRMQELPEKKQHLLVVVDDCSAKAAEDFLTERQFDYSIVHWQSVEQADLCDAKFSVGASNQRLWQPAKFIKDFQQTYLADSDSKKSLKVLDIASGSGRDSIYLAMQGHEVYAVDYSQTALERLSISASQYNVSITTACIDLENGFDQLLPSNFPALFDAVIVCRYLHRPLMPFIESIIADNGFIAYQTFMVGSEKIGSPRNPNFLLKPGELAETFQDFSILQDEVIHLDDGRPMTAFIGQKSS
ncbi:MAG: methyltransferase domain-containing protein [Kangiellaceae bacterium]|jgi:SAM-dependent methyltransferase|nr:methyltransferase domain-containing protein [Kangiellaceae bacterium]